MNRDLFLVRRVQDSGQVIGLSCGNQISLGPGLEIEIFNIALHLIDGVLSAQGSGLSENIFGLLNNRLLQAAMVFRGVVLPSVTDGQQEGASQRND